MKMHNKHEEVKRNTFWYGNTSGIMLAIVKYHGKYENSILTELKWIFETNKNQQTFKKVFSYYVRHIKCHTS